LTSNPPNWRRRALLAGGAVAIVTWVKTAPYLLSLRKQALAFEDIDGLAPFRRVIVSRPITTAGAVFVGLDAPVQSSPEDEQIQRMVRRDPCTAFFGPRRSGAVPLAMFSDFACPICKMMNKRLAEIQANTPDSFRLVRHELPLLGVASKTASRAVLASERQDAYLEMHDRLSRTPAVTDEAFVARIADDIGLDSDKLLRDMNSAEVEQHLRVSRAIADVFGFYGTPAFAVGRTVFLGSMSVASLEWLIANEVENPCQ
jgi:predicted DsbA family dithiol-disulfide isomerase